MTTPSRTSLGSLTRFLERLRLTGGEQSPEPSDAVIG